MSGETSPAEKGLLANEHHNGTNQPENNQPTIDRSNYVPPASPLYDNDSYLNEEEDNYAASKHATANGVSNDLNHVNHEKAPAVPQKETSHPRHANDHSAAVGDGYMRFDDLVEDDGSGNTQRKAILSDHGMILAPPPKKYEMSKVWFKRLVAIVFAGGVITVLVIILIIVADKSSNKKNLNLFPLSAPNCYHPVYCQGPLLAAVQEARIFSDQKTFVDMPIKKNPVAGVTINSATDLLTIFNAEASKPNFNLTAFVNLYFDAAGSEVVAVIPSDFRLQPEYTLNPQTVSNPSILNFSLGVHQAWRSLMRTFNVSAPDTSTTTDSPYCSDCHSSIYAKSPFVVPGGRFTEYYYWDSLWIIEGLLVSEMFDTARGMIENFIDMINQFGFMPNGARLYYLSRSQPPMLSEMVNAYYQACLIAANATNNGNGALASSNYTKMGADLIAKALPALIKEHAFFTQSHHRVVGSDFSDTAAQRILAANNGGNVVDYTTDASFDPYANTILGNNYMWLNRYFTDTVGPRPESYMEDIDTANSVFPLSNSTPASSQTATMDSRDWVYSQLAAGAESGYDYTVRWFNNSQNSFYQPHGDINNINNRNNYANISTIQVENVIPADLNALLLAVEERIATWTNGDSTTNTRTTPASETSFDKYLISPRNGVYYSELLVAATGGSLVDSATSLMYAQYANRRRHSMMQVLMAPAPRAPLNSTRMAFSDFNHQSGTWSLTEQAERSGGQLPTVYYSGFVPPYMIPSIATYHLNEAQQRGFLNDMAAFAEVGGAPASNASVPSSTGIPQQWDYANGWAPTQYFISRALKLSASYFGAAASNPIATPSEVAANSSLSQQATTLRQTLVQRWINNCYCGWQVPYTVHNDDGTTSIIHALMEKYHVDTDNGSSGNGGEYVPQLGFGWTNGLSLYLVREDGSWLTSPSSLQCSGN